MSLETNMNFDYGIKYDESTLTLHILRPEEYLKVHLRPFSFERLDMNNLEKGFKLCFPAELNFRNIRRILFNSKNRFDFSNKTVQIFFLPNAQYQESDPGSIEQRKRASMFYLWKFWNMLNKNTLHQTMRFRELHIKLIYVFERCRGMLDLAKSNPGLTFYLIMRHNFDPENIDWTIANLNYLSSLKQKDIALSMNLKPEIISTLKRIHPKALSEHDFSQYIEYINSNDYPKYVHHLKTINRSHIKILSEKNLRQHVSCKYMIELARSHKEIHAPITADMLKGIIDISEKFNIPIPKRFFSQQQINHIIIRHPYLIGYAPELLGLQLPSPPIQPEPHIRAISDPIEIIKEGHEMSNCLAELPYLDLIKKGAYLYKLLDSYGIKDRATLLVAPAYNKDIQKYIYVIQEIKGKFNEPIQGSTIKAVEDWLITAQLLDDSKSIQMIQEFRQHTIHKKQVERNLFFRNKKNNSSR